MTTGQRISDKRKELGLSQEGLGEKLGVSRQSIYKWESDASLPDIDKLIVLSRLFGVSVGWLLGVEEESPAPAAAEPSVEDQRQRQEQLVEEVLRRYQAAQPVPQKSVWDKWSVRILFLICGIMLSAFLSIDHKMDQLASKYRALESSVDQISAETTLGMDRLTDRMETILTEQNRLTADYKCTVKSFGFSEDTLTFSLSVVPKTYVEGMSVLFRADSSGELIEVSGIPDSNHAFTAELTCPLTDSIQISAVFITRDIQQVQPLETFLDVYSDSLPCYHYEPNDTALHTVGQTLADGSYRVNEHYVYFAVDDDLTQYKTDFGIVCLESVEVGLFLNQELVHWLEPSKRPTDFEGASKYENVKWVDFFHDGYSFFHSPQTDGLTVNEGDTLFFAARFTDEYGRQYMVPSENRYVMRGGTFLRLGIGDPANYMDPTDYQF